MREYNEIVGSSEKICSFCLLKDPPSLAAGEITDKAYVNQRAVLKHRAEQAERLYCNEAAARMWFGCEDAFSWR